MVEAVVPVTSPRPLATREEFQTAFEEVKVQGDEHQWLGLLVQELLAADKGKEMLDRYLRLATISIANGMPLELAIKTAVMSGFTQGFMAGMSIQGRRQDGLERADRE